MSCKNISNYNYSEDFIKQRNNYLREIENRYEDIENNKSYDANKKYDMFKDLFRELLENNNNIRSDIARQQNAMGTLENEIESAENNSDTLQRLVNESKNISLISKEKLEIENQRAQDISKDYTKIVAIVSVILFMQMGLLFL